MACFRVVANQFRCDDTVYKKGDVIDTHLDLEKRAFKGIVERIDPASLHGVSQSVSPRRTRPPAGISPSPKPEPSPVSAALGEDVTESFPLAEPEGFKVYEKEGMYFVQDPDQSPTALNPEGLKKGEVNKFIKRVTAD